MRRNGFALATLAPVVLVFSMLLAHVLEIPGKMRLDGADWLTVQQHLYIAFAPAGAVGEIASILLAWALFFRLRQTAGRGQALAAALCVSAALALWFILVAPMNARLNGWTAASLPADWTATRNRWEAGHALAFLLYAAALLLLVRLAAGRDRVAAAASSP